MKKKMKKLTAAADMKKSYRKYMTLNWTHECKESEI